MRLEQITERSAGLSKQEAISKFRDIAEIDEEDPIWGYRSKDEPGLWRMFVYNKDSNELHGMNYFEGMDDWHPLDKQDAKEIASKITDPDFKQVLKKAYFRD